MPDERQPKSIAGKTVASRSNLKHGGAACRLFLPDEDPDEFFALLESAFELYQPCREQDVQAVSDTAHAKWILLRRQRAFEYYEGLLVERKPDPMDWTAEEDHRLRLFDRYKIQAERAQVRALKNVKHIRSPENVAWPRRWQELYALERERFEKELDALAVAA